MKTAIQWYRNDLRVTDNTALTQACKAEQVLALYFFDPRFFQTDQLGIKRTGKFRARFLLESVLDLYQHLGELNIPLLIYIDRPEEVIPKLVARYRITEIHTQKEWTRDEAVITEAVSKVLPKTVALHQYFDQFLFHPEDIPFDSFSKIPEVFTAFRKACEKSTQVRHTLPVPEKRTQFQWGPDEFQIPRLEDLGIEHFKTDPRTAFPFQGGSSAAWNRIQAYFWKERRLSYYKKTRNGLVGKDYSTKFSPWLANGSLSPREVYREVRSYEEEVVKNQDTYWVVFELIWRDFFKYTSLKHGDRIFRQEGIKNTPYNPVFSYELFLKWTQGKTKNTFVNANMLELAQTGWMSNRGRQNVASYWTKELGQDWRVGAAYFESMLLDYDVHSNWGNWMYNSGVGNDPRDRKFNPNLQAERYDPNGAFRRLWLHPTLFKSGTDL